MLDDIFIPQLGFALLGRELVTRCVDRVEAWTPRQCEADILVKFCTSLAENSRYFILHADVTSLLNPHPDSLQPEKRIYRHDSDLRLYLFNDALVIACRQTRYKAYSPVVQTSYRFQTCVDLSSLSIEDVDDEYGRKNIFKLAGPLATWICATERYESKMTFLSAVRVALSAALLP
ncbi:PREDICTED: epithelial cell-transforming sequence 2 oncogene-like [Priapulus caudatus]|uniref:Epithelial cell-transforming sequence 2 oncogene-like n=1 Tax=Priapulus caudatus TaxID=37621 RepID=A0ABM1E2E6_PRICU|nr:PREDICTED: epithelial cell-transforming sequence 2 oncogene-like [Priapulus caudatus]